VSPPPGLDFYFNLTQASFLSLGYIVEALRARKINFFKLTSSIVLLNLRKKMYFRISFAKLRRSDAIHSPQCSPGGANCGKPIQIIELRRSGAIHCPGCSPRGANPGGENL